MNKVSIFPPLYEPEQLDFRKIFLKSCQPANDNRETDNDQI